ncbi:HAD-IIIC family phosphatase [Streptomyces qinzhouensis]|uniref:HAD-IIIC family phosphatase n=1 Tax=Streptomyces qinzhouensis TaxID=2599401 RepID=A0A5B8JF87_9ACTN|nr:HAD-IIIC family phosphatase [Streptomyces qinzhouensis]QDY80445.1 HAD-IIIC family phosphatase [Streptomyces qinzhouensis]
MDLATPAAPVGEELAALHRDHRLATDYPRLSALLAEATDEERERTGRHLGLLGPDEVRRAHPGLPTLRTAVTGDGTLSPLLPALAAEAARHGLLLPVTPSPYNTWVPDLSDPGSDLYAARPGLVLCVLSAAVVTAELPSPWHVDDIRRVLEDKTALIESLADRFAETGDGTLVLNTLLLPRELTAQLLDHRSRARLGIAWREANLRLLRLAESHPRLVVLDLDPLAAETPAHDARLSAYAKVHLSPGILARYAREAGHLARRLLGHTKKALVLDLDGTLWGGILGDDGPEGIEVGDGARGEAFTAFQRVARQIGSQGVLLSVVSKNDLEPVRRVLRDHPGMTLREDDFVRVTANWQPKHLNLRALADDLGIGADSLVFADDSPYECGLVRREIPGAAVVRLDDEPADHVNRLLADNWFDSAELTTEDRARPAHYRGDLARKDFRHGFESLEGYLRELGVTVRLAPAAPEDISRLSQITLRTNQFNLTTVRLGRADIETLLGRPDTLVLTIRSADRFGDNGTVGAVIATRHGTALVIDNFLLSCRVFARGIEQAVIAAVLRHAERSGLTEVFGIHRPTAKNGKTAGFYPHHGFAPAAADALPAGPAAPVPPDPDDRAVHRHDLRTVPPVPDHIRLDATFEGPTP